MPHPFNRETLISEAYNWPVYYRELGYYVTQREEYDRSLKYFDQALKKEPDDIRTLHGRAVARAKSIKFQGALEDIETILSIDPENISLRAEKALITYLSCEFEKALILNVRNVPLRRKPDNFVMGVMHCEDAILNCISERAGKPLRDHFKLIRQIAWRKTLESQRPYTPVTRNRKKRKRSIHQILPSTRTDKEKKADTSYKKRLSTGKYSYDSLGNYSDISETSSIAESLYRHESSLNNFKIPPPPVSFPYKPFQNYTSNIENYLAERYLDKLYHDKLFLKSLPLTPGTITANDKGSEKIKLLAAVGFKNVYRTQEILRARRPFYFIKYQEATACGKLEQRKQEALLMLRKMALQQADNLIRKMENSLKDRSIKNVFENTEKLMTFLENTPKRVFPSNQEYMLRLVNISCEAFFQAKKFTRTMTLQQKKDRIAILLGLRMERTPSTDSLLNDIKDWCIDWKKMSGVYKKRLFKAKSAEELAWLYHELARFSLEMKRYELSRMYARKCLSEANVCQNLKWIFNAMILTTRIDLSQKNKNDAIGQIKRAKKIANIIKDRDLVELCDLSVGIIDKFAVDESIGIKILEEREKQIIRLLPTEKLKSEAAFLFRRIATLPFSKRMSPLPGFRYDDVIEMEDKKKRKISSSDSKEPRGIGFLKLIP